jgi:hypothetical protein
MVFINGTGLGTSDQRMEVILGFSRVAYHVGMEAVVNIEPMKPAARHTPMLIANLIISIALMCSISHTPK